MTPSEIAFLALGLLLGIATGAAIVMAVLARPPKHEIRVTVTRDAVPRRASTLAADVFQGLASGPAPGGPGDRRLTDRHAAMDRTSVRPDGLPVVAAPILPWRSQPVLASTTSATRQGVIAIEPETDPLLVGLGVIAGPDHPVEPVLPGLLAGDHAATLRVIESIAGPDEASRRAWDTLLTRFVEAIRQRSIDLGLLDLPMGNAFWDTFTIDQCRQIVVALQATGRRFDGVSDWADGLVPTYRDLSRALAEIGVDPRRIRAWPNSLEIAELFRGARVATVEAIERMAPTLEADQLQAFLADRDRGLDELWPVWDAVRVALGLGEAAEIAASA